jgi:NCS1 family nucleobase:cation symporter-1
VALLGRFDNVIVVIISMFALTIATLSTNIAANVVAPANSIANIKPSKISYKLGGYITGVIGILMFPWKLIADPTGYIFTWLIGYSALLGALAGVMICDYFLIRKTSIDLPALFKTGSIYKGWNVNAWIAFVVSLLPVIPGFLVTVGALDSESVGSFWKELYSYTWFVTFGIAFWLYYVLMKMVGRKSGV